LIADGRGRLVDKARGRSIHRGRRPPHLLDALLVYHALTDRRVGRDGPPLVAVSAF
jgi:hypothetical protein